MRRNGYGIRSASKHELRGLAPRASLRKAYAARLNTDTASHLPLRYHFRYSSRFGNHVVLLSLVRSADARQDSAGSGEIS